MALNWKDFSGSDYFKGLPEPDQGAARQRFFDDQVAPRFAPEQRESALAEFNRRTMTPATVAAPAQAPASIQRPQANVAARAAVAPPVAEQAAMPQRPVRPGQVQPAAAEPAIAAPAGGAGFVEGVKDFGRGIARGVVEDLPAAVAGLTDFADTPDFDAQGKMTGDAGASEWARDVKAGAEQRGENWQESEFGRQMRERDAFSARGAAYEAGKAMPLSFGGGLAGAATGAAIGSVVPGLGTAAGAGVGYLAGSIGSLPLFFGHQAKDTYDKVFAQTKQENPQISDEDAHDRAMGAGGMTGAIEAGGELVADLVGAKLFKLLPSGAKQGMVRAATKSFQGVRPMIADMLKIVGTEVGTELAQGASQSAVEASYGVGEGPTWDNQKGVIMPTVLMSLVGGGAAVGMSARERYRTSKLLANPSFTPQQRLGAAQNVARALHQQDPELAKLFFGEAQRQIAAGKPVIAEDDKFYRDLKPLSQREEDQRLAAGEDMPSEEARTAAFGEAPADVPRGTEIPPEAFAQPEGAEAADTLATDENGDIIIEDGGDAPGAEIPADRFARPEDAPVEALPAESGVPGVSPPTEQPITDAAAVAPPQESQESQPPAAPAADSAVTLGEAGEATAQPAPAAEQTLAATPGEAPLTPEARKQHMTAIGANLKVLRAERDAAKKAGDEALMAEVDDEIQATAVNFKRLANNQAPLPTPREQAAGSTQNLGQDPAQNLGQVPAMPEAPALEPAAALPKNDGIDLADEQPVKALDDERMQDPDFRNWMESAVGGLVSVKDGNLGLVVDPNFIKGESDRGDEVRMIRAGSVNPPWFQEIAAAENVSVDGLRGIVKKAMTGAKLGVRQDRAVRKLMDAITDERIGELQDWGRGLGMSAEEVAGLHNDNPVAHMRALEAEVSARQKKAADAEVEQQWAEQDAVVAGKKPFTPDVVLGEDAPDVDGYDFSDQEAIEGHVYATAVGWGVPVAQLDGLHAQAPDAESFLSSVRNAIREIRANEKIRSDQGEAGSVADIGGPGAPESGESAAAEAERLAGIEQARAEAIPALEEYLGTDWRKDNERRARLAAASPDELVEEVYRDKMTGLLNKRAWNEDVVKAGFEKEGRRSKPSAIVYIDLDGLKFLNDEMGHAAGDELLANFGAAMKASGIDGYHISGDEFGAIFENEADASEAMDRLQWEVESSVVRGKSKDGRGITNTGIAFSYGLGGSANSADMAMQANKKDREAQGLRGGARGGMPSTAAYDEESVLQPYDQAAIDAKAAEEAARAKKDADAAAKQKADDERGDFVLAGSARPADQAAARGAQDMFSGGAPAAPAAPKAKPSANTVFTEDAAAAARERLRAKLGRPQTGLDPESVMDGITLAGYHIERGARTFSAYAKAMLADLGDAVRPYLKSWYVAISLDPRAAAFDGMDSYDAVKAVDVDAITGGPEVDPINTAAHEAATSPQNDLAHPTEAQIEAENHKMGHVLWNGLDMTIQFPAGTKRNPDWKTLNAHYGHLKRTEAADGEQVDVFINPDEARADKVVVIDQYKGGKKSGGYDEAKVMVGYPDKMAAINAYKGNYPDGWQVGPVTEMSVDEFKAWLKDGDSTKPVADAPAKMVGPTYKPGQIIRANIDGKPEYVIVRNEWTDAERSRGEPISVRTQAMVARIVEIQESDVLPDETPAASDEHAGKWFGSKDKALQYLAKKKIGPTHKIVQAGTRFEIQPIAPASAQAYAGETPATENNDAKRPVDQPGAGALAGKPAAAVRPAEEVGGTGTGSAGSGSSNAGGTGNAAGAGAGLASSMGNGAGTVPVSASGAASVGAGAAELDLFGVRGPAAAETAASPGGRGDAPGLVAPAQLSPDFVITDDVDLGGGGEKTKYRRNVDAIRLLNTLESEGRYATADEQRTLALYVGWGGLQGAFDPNNEKWAKEYAELKDLMTPEEYAEAAQSTQYAHYTSKEIIGGIYGALERMGFTGGKVLEAGGGVGNFIGLMPDAMRTAGRFTLVERERIAAGIAKHLYPQQNVQKADFAAFGRGADGQYDVAAGNPPFSRTALSDQSGRKHLSGLRIHNYFIAKEIDLLRPGGILANVVSNGFLDSADSRARDYIAGRAKFLGAIRLPNNAFSKNAGTEVTTDIVFFQKLPESEWGSRAAKKDAERWTTLGRMSSANGGEKIPTNIYFVNNPQMMLGNWGRFGSMYRADQPALVAKPGQNTALDLVARLLDLPANIYQPAAVTGTQNIVDAAVVALNNPTVSEGGFYLQDGKLFERLPDNAGQPYGRALTPASKWTEKTLLGKSGHDRLVALVNLRGTLRSLLAAEMADDQKAMDRLRAQLNTQYDAYAKDALLNDPGTTRYFGDDPDYPLLASLELDYKPGVGAAAAKKAGISPFKSSAKKAAIFTRRVVDHRKPVSKADSPQDALNISLAERGVIDADYIGNLLGKDPQSVLEELASGEKPLLFMDPATNEYVLRDEYLSGNVRRKLAQARQSGMMANARALEQVQPEDVGAGEISARIGSPWVPPTIYADFAKSILGEGTKAILQYVPFDSSFTGYIEAGSRVADTSTYGTKDYEASRLIYSMLNNREIKVTYTDSDGKTHTDKEGTELARDKAQEIREKFQDWLFADSDRAEALVRAYNDANNNYVTRVFDGSWLTFPGKVPDEIIKFRRHQRNFVARVMQTRTALADHVVGAGKTYSAIAAAMELKRTGLAKKPMIVVPNHLVKQWATDFYRLYPGANILTATKKDFERVNRRRFLGKIATGDWDAVIIAHSSFNFIKPDPAFEEEFTKAEVKELMDLIAQIEKADDSKDNKRKVKQLQSQQERLENKLKSLREKPVDDMLDFEQLGVDQLFVDEAHLFKNLMFSTKMQNIRGLGDAKGSQRAFDMFIKVNETFKKNGRGQGVVFLTGTPVSNSLAEMYHMMRYLMPEQMREAKFWPFDAWANTYASIEETLKPKTSGNGYKTVTAFGAFTNTFELLKMFDQVSDTVTMDDIKSAYSEENGGAEFPLPKVKTGRRQPVAMEMSEAQSAYMEEIAKRAEALEQRKGPPQKGEDNHLKVMGDARKAALDVRLVDTTVTEREKGARLDRAAGEIHARYKQFEAERGTQLVFSDLGTPIKSAKKELEKYHALQERINRAADPKVQQDAALGDDAAIDIMNDAEEAQAEIDEQGSDWLDGIKAALRGFSVYDDLKAALIERGIPEAQIAFIHDFNTDDQKAGLFRKVNDGTIRVLMGSTPKLGAGTNVQQRLVALHHIDIPWKPSDVEQREGRIIRQGNRLADEIPGFEVEILAYVTKDTLDKNMWDIQERKLRGINQLRSRQISREIENSFDEMEMSASEMQAAATGNVDLLREIQLRNDIQKLERKKRGFDAQQADRDNRRKRAQQLIATLPADIALAEKADAYAKEYRDTLQKMQDEFTVTIDGTAYTDWKKAGLYLREQVDKTITDEAGKEKPAPLSVTINGEKYTNRTKMTEAFTELRGDADPVIWELDGTTLRRRNAIEKAIRQRVADALAEQTEQPIGRIGQYGVTIEGDGLEAVNVTMKAPGGIETGMKLSVPKVDPEDAARIAGTSIVRAAANHAIAAGEAAWRKNLLKNAQRDLTELGEAGAAVEWPDMPKLDALRAEYKAVMARIKAGGFKPPAGMEGPLHEVGAAGVYGFYSREGKAGSAPGHTESALYTRLRDVFGAKFMDRLFTTGKFRVIGAQEAANILGMADTDALRSGGAVRGFYHRGNGITYLVADSIPAGFTDAQLKGLMRHEIGVHALKAGRDSAGWQNILGEIDRLIDSGDKAVHAAFLRAGAAGTRDVDLLEEVAGYLVEDAPDSSIARQIIAWFKNQIYKLTGFQMKLTDADIVAMARSALRRAPDLLAHTAAAPRMTPVYSSPAPVWVSALRQHIAEQGAKTRTGNDWSAWLIGNAAKLGIKKDEIEWSGITDYLTARGKEKLKTTDITDWLEANGVQVEEVMLGERADGAPIPAPAEQAFLQRRDQLEHQLRQKGWGVEFDPIEMYAVAVYPLNDPENEAATWVNGDSPTNDPTIDFDEAAIIEEMLELRESDFDDGDYDDGYGETGARFGRFQIPGGDKYRELLLKLPANPLEQDGKNFYGGHFDQANILAHVRFNERTDASGRRVLFIEEIQSDWAQQGRKRGKGGVPDAPFIGDTKAWVALALKRMIRYATDNGFDTIAWTTGEQQADRYDLSKQVGEVAYFPSGHGVGNGTLVAMPVGKTVDGGGASLFERDNVSLDHIEDYLGKEAARKLLEQPLENDRHTLRSPDLKVGGEGMKAFYDGIVPQVARDLLKKLGGGNLEPVKIDQMPGGPREMGDVLDRQENPDFKMSAQPGFPITDRMREIAGRGMAMFSRAASVGSEAFRKWFGDSKVVDAEGKPLVVYHGTNADVKAFNPARLGASVDNPTTKFGFYFTNDAADAASWADRAVERGRARPAQNVLPVYLAIKNPVRLSEADFHQYLRKARESTIARHREKWEASGHDGIITTRAGKDWYIAFRPEQIKSAIGNRGTFDSGNPDILFSRAQNPVQGALVPPAQPPVPPQQGTLNVQGGATGPGAQWASTPTTPLGAFADTMLYRYQDKHIDLKRTQQAIKAAGRKINEASDAYLKEELFHGRAATRAKEFLEDELDPLVADMRARGVSQEDLGRYLWARHAPEANEHIAAINPALPDGGSGMLTQEAQDYLAALTPQQQADYAALAARVDAITQTTRNALVNDKLISAQQRQDWESAYQHYVPLFRELDANDDIASLMMQGAGTGQGYSIKGAESKRRTGSQLPVADILGNIANARDKAIVRGEKARVGRALYAMALTNKNPDFWRTAVAAPTIKTHDKNGMVIEIPDPLFKQRDNVVVVKVPTRKGNIVERAVIFNERDPRAARMARAIKNLDGQQLGEFLGAAASVTRYFASINTQYNPIFGVVNLTRDVQTAMLNLSSTPLAGKQAAVAADIARIVGGALKHGLRDFDGPWKAIAREFEEAGGMTGYRDMFRSGRERTEAIEKALDPNWWQKRPWGKVLTADGYLKAPAELMVDKGVRPVMEWLSDYNQVLENATRLAAYKQARDMGLSKDASASIAKNLTVNFNRKGEMALQLGALYAFFNAATQGIARMGQTFAGPAGKYIVGGGVLVGALQAMLLAAAGYDDEEPKQFVRERALILPTPWRKEKYFSLPMPLGFHVLPNFGRLTVEAMQTGDVMGKTASMMGVMADAFNPLGGSAPVAQILSPTATDPFISLGMNRDWTNSPIAREDFSNLHPTPGFTRARDAAGAPARWLAKALNRLSGGTDYTQGLISPTPDQIEYLAGQLTGGIGREAIKASTTATSIVTGDELPMHKVPLIGRFYGSTEGRAPQANKFYSNLKRLNEHGATVKGLRADRRNAEVMEYLRDNPDARLYEAAGKAERKVSELRARRRAMVERDASKAELKRVDDLITAQMVQLNDRMKALSK